MMNYLVKRILISLPTLLTISVVIFLILALAPGDPLSEFASNPNITQEVRENLRQSLGLDKPIYIRYFKWLFAFLQGNLGYSFSSRSPVFNLILQRLPNTLMIVGVAYFISVFMAIPLGLISAIKRYSFLDNIITIISFFGYSIPPFFSGLLLIIIFSVQLKWLPFIYDSNLEIINFATFFAQIKQSIMPIMVLSLYQTAILMRFMRSSVTEELSHDYVRTAYSKGLNSYQVVVNHIFRNALIPVITLIALDIPSIFTGALVTEQIFRIPGIGALLIDSIYRSDTPVIMAIAMIYGILIVIFNLIADLTYSWLDPRVKLH
ncbi:MAG: ABC transporter permease [Cyanobacteria bacterium]|nr:ABC transporter permease [Cyanobacteria bacterium CG_2015-16_32_12]NCO76718.1 ABC transporter permease [Cyanobacteria bacterium CG_2015-22_32_23]NCQ40951.1 ABC transporter permease [Cyanobacteria bacterium CG_2015-04_32_10]NCS85270.1 ABC transporter permease [Cyanobacteria bacterium CG_2015-02_32_10]